MSTIIERRKGINEEANHIYRPELFRLNNTTDREKLETLLNTHPQIVVLDQLNDQLKELIKTRNPAFRLTEEEYKQRIAAHLDSTDTEAYGVWVYYPWSQRLVHLLDEMEFIEVRTNRNQYKITLAEQQSLAQKKIGVIGLSVGQSIAITIAMERACGEIRLADFDTIELNNMNRIRTSVCNLGLNKAVLAAREIAEIDPYLNVVVFTDGINESNVDTFFTANGRLDLLVEVCDGLDTKVSSRFYARSLGIPVVMDTNDRGMLDVERFDLEPKRPLFHGLAGDLDPEQMKGLTNEEKVPYILKLIGADQISTRLKASFLEVEQSISTWPQLASSVVLGGGLTTDVVRRILLNQFHESGRYYVDVESIIQDTAKPAEEHTELKNPYTPLTEQEIRGIADTYLSQAAAEVKLLPEPAQLDKIVEAAIASPSAGNNQPWRFYYNNGVFLLFHDKYRSWSWGDFDEMGAHAGLGTVLENIHIQAAALGMVSKPVVFPLPGEPRLIAAITFAGSEQQPDSNTLSLSEGLYTRATNRRLGASKKLPAAFYQEIKNIGENFEGIGVSYIEDEDKRKELGLIMAACDRIRLLTKTGHEEFYSELRWNREQAEATRDGVELASVDLTQGEIAGFSMAQDWNAIKLLAEWDKGNGFGRMSTKAMDAASGAILFTVPAYNRENMLQVGRAVQRAWIYANMQGVSVHPMLSPVFFFTRMKYGPANEMPAETLELLKNLRQRFITLFPSVQSDAEAFLIKVSLADDTGLKSLRKNKHELFYLG